MAFKLVLNVLYTIGAVLCIFVAFRSFGTNNYPVAIGALVVGGVVVVLKIKLLKQVRNAQKKP